MKLSLHICASFLASSVANAAKHALRKSDDSLFYSPTHDRKLTHTNDIDSGTPVVDLCQYYPKYGVYDPLPVSVKDGRPDQVFKIENAAGITFTFSTCDATQTNTTISILDGFNQGRMNYLSLDDDSCGNQSRLSWTAPSNSVYYVRFGAWLGFSYSANATWSTDVDWGYCIPTAPYQCGQNILYPLSGSWAPANHTLLCCDNNTGAVGPNCYSAVPYDGSASTCCGDRSIVSGVDKALCSPSSQPTDVPSPKPSLAPSSCPSPQPTSAPSSKPSFTPSASPMSKPTTMPSAKPSIKLTTTPSSKPSSQPTTSPSTTPSLTPSSNPSSQPTNLPTSKPSSFPSSQPSQLTCEMVNPCDYESEDDGMGDIDIIETYYPACIHQETAKKSVYHQECYPESIIARLGAGDVDPEHDDRMIVNCGCCPSDDMLPADIEIVNGSTDVCDCGLDCLAESASASFSKLGKKTYFQMCIDGDDDNWENNFYVPADDETASCGHCDDGNIIV